tara:strand:+ start:102 stop:410 length:309 start_codon:yes stop_codon:yes gene_type:complete
MKKLIFLLLFVGFFSSADEYCVVELSKENFREFIKTNCVKDDIIKAGYDGGSLETEVAELHVFAGFYCRFDREIIFKVVNQDAILTCVLNSDLPRSIRGILA